MKTAKKFYPYERNGRIIRRFRDQLEPKMSQERLAAIIGTTRRHMIRLENGEHLPSIALRDKIAEAVGTSREAIQAADEDDEDSSMALTREQKVERLTGYLLDLLGEDA